jgi:hypothetical protein
MPIKVPRLVSPILPLSGQSRYHPFQVSLPMCYRSERGMMSAQSFSVYFRAAHKTAGHDCIAAYLDLVAIFLVRVSK